MLGDPAKLKRCGIAAGFLVVFGAFAAWVVQREAQSFRQSLEQASPPKPEADDDDLPNVPPRLVATNKQSAVAPAVTPQPAATPDKEPVKSQPIPAPEKAKDPSPANTEKTDLAKAEKNAAEASPEYDGDVKKVFDLDHFTVEDDKRLGAILHNLILKISNPAPDGPETGRVHEVCGELFAKAKRPEIVVTILQSPEFNAFSHPGGQGYLYITTGMLERIGTEEDYVLKFAVAHELAHLELGHTLQCLQFRDMRELLKKANSVGTAAVLCQLVIPNAHKDEMEFAADQWALSRMRESGHDRYEALKFLRKFQAYAKEQNFLQGHVFPKPGDERSTLDNHYRAHVRIKERLDRAESFWDGKPAPK